MNSLKRYKILALSMFLLIAFLALAAFLFTKTDFSSSAQSQERPNILIILADDLGYSDLGSYGNDFIRTPRLDRLASEGMKFTNFYSNGAVCSPTRASILSGQYPSRYGLRYVCGQSTQTGLSDDTKLLPQYLQDEGYKTYHIGKWHLGSNDPNIPDFTPVNKGYHYFFGFLMATDTVGPNPDPNAESTTYNDPYLKENFGEYQQHSGHLTDILADKVIDTITSHDSEEPFFITYWPYAPHIPDQPLARWSNQYPDTVEGQYAAVVSGLDQNIGKILDQLEQSGKAENTLVIFLSDNGGTAVQHPNGNGLLNGSKGTLFEGGIKVPMIIRWPGKVPAGSENDNLILTMDILPTLSELLGLDLTSAIVDGQSFLSQLLGDYARVSRGGSLFWEHQPPGRKLIYAVRNEKWKYIVDTNNDQRYLFNLERDPYERVNRYSSDHNVVGVFEQLYKQWRRQTATISYEIMNTVGNVTIIDDVISLDNENSMAEIKDNIRLNPDIYSMTVSMWVYPTDDRPGIERLVSKGQTWRVYLNNQNKLVFGGDLRDLPGQSNIWNSNVVIPTNQWTHIAISMAIREDVKIYINGQVAASAPYQLLLVDKSDIQVGNSKALNQGFVGKIKALTFYNTDLTDQEIQRYMRQTTPTE